MYLTIDEFLAELKAINWIQNNPQIIDDASVARWVHLELKGFGRGVMTQEETMVHIHKGIGMLPENFASLSLAVHCEPLIAEVEKGEDLLMVQSRLVGERLTCFEDKLCDDCPSFCHENECNERIVENYYLPKSKVKLHYHKPMYVKIGSGFGFNKCVSDCPNLGVKDSPFSINIKGNKVIANFDEGHIYIRYYGIPVDEKGLPLIPVTQNGHLEKYLEMYVKLRILEDAMLSGDLTNVQGIYDRFKSQEWELKRKANADISSIDMVALFKMLDTNRARMQKYEVSLGAIKSNYNSSGYFQTLNPNRF